jgi:hypothetical protein
VAGGGPPTSLFAGGAAPVRRIAAQSRMNSEFPILVNAAGKPRCVGRTCGPNIREEGRAIRYMSEQCKRACEAGSNLCGKCMEYEMKGATAKRWHGRYGARGNLPAYSHIRGSEWNLTTRAKEDAKVAGAAAKLAAVGTAAEEKAAKEAAKAAAVAAKATERLEKEAAAKIAKAEKERKDEEKRLATEKAKLEKARKDEEKRLATEKAKIEKAAKAAKKEELDMLQAAGKLITDAEKAAEKAAREKARTEKAAANALRRETAKAKKATTAAAKKNVTRKKSSSPKRKTASNHKRSSSAGSRKKTSSGRRIYTAVSRTPSRAASPVAAAGGAGRANSLNRNIANSLAEFGFNVNGLRMPSSSSSSSSRMSTPPLE